MIMSSSRLTPRPLKRDGRVATEACLRLGETQIFPIQIFNGYYVRK